MKSANEAAAIKTLRTIAEQQMLYYSSHRRTSFGTFDEMLKTCLTLCGNHIVEVIFSRCRLFRSQHPQPGYAVNADPVTEGVGATGKKHFYLDSDSNTIHVTRHSLRLSAIHRLGNS